MAGIIPQTINIISTMESAVLLIITNHEDVTADFVESRLIAEGRAYFRWNTDNMPNQTHSLQISGTSQQLLLGVQQGVAVNADMISCVWFRRPELPDIKDQSPQVSQFVKVESLAYLQEVRQRLESARWVSKPTAIQEARSKSGQLIVAARQGFRTPRTVVTNDPATARAFFRECGGRVVVKVLRQTALRYGTEVASLYTHLLEEPRFSELVEAVKMCPALFQEYIEKQYELRVTVFGAEVFVARIDSQADPFKTVDWRRPSPTAAQWEGASIPSTVADMCTQVVRAYGLSFGAIDLAVTPSGDFVFFEVNANGQWAWLEMQTGQPMTAALLRTLYGPEIRSTA